MIIPLTFRTARCRRAIEMYMSYEGQRRLSDWPRMSYGSLAEGMSLASERNKPPLTGIPFGCKWFLSEVSEHT